MGNEIMTNEEMDNARHWIIIIRSGNDFIHNLIMAMGFENAVKLGNKLARSANKLAKARNENKKYKLSILEPLTPEQYQSKIRQFSPETDQLM